MRWVAPRASGGLLGTGRAGWSAHLFGQTFQALLIAVTSGGLFWLVWVYASGLRDPRYLDGWVLAVGMGVQLYFHVARKKARLSPRSAVRWRKVHILVGYFLIAAFVLHSDFSLPDTAFEWALWASFVLVAISGVFGTYLTWSLQAKRRIDENIAYERIPDRRAELADEVRKVVAQSEPATADMALPAPSYDTWIVDLYTHHLHEFLRAPRNFTGHLVGSQRHLKRLTDEIDSLSRYIDHAQSRERLAAIKAFVLEKDQLDFTRTYLSLTRAWLFVHVPLTYTLIVLVVVHILVVYAYSAGLW